MSPGPAAPSPPGGAARVVHVGPALDVRGGISTVERLSVEALTGRLDVRHVSTTRDDAGPVRRLTVFAAALRRVSALCRDRRPTVVHVHFASRGSTLRKGIVAAVVLRRGRPLVLHAHGGGYREFFAALPSPLRARVRSLWRRADAFVVLSAQWRQYYADVLGIDPGRIHVLANPVRLPDRVPDRAGRESVRFAHLGRISDDKGAFALVAAYRALDPAVRSRVRLEFAGDGEIDRLRRAVCDLGDAVTVHEWMTAADRDALLAGSDALVLPSRHEGLPMVVLEAMAAGLPVVATPVGGIPDLVTDLETGLVVPVDDVPALAAAMTRVVVDEPLRLRLGRAARERVRGHGLDAYGEQLAGLYAPLLANVTRTVDRTG